jgi:phosphatidylglycerophosphate synthase
VLRAGLFYDERVLSGLAAAQNILVEHPLNGAATPVAAACDGSRLAEVVAAMRAGAGEVPAELQPATVLDLAPAYDPALRKSQEPFVYSAEAADLREVENRIFAASYKGITDIVTKWVFPVPAREVVRVLARWGVHPNTVTAVSYVLAAAVTWLFWEGWFATGLVLGWTMSFLDTVDGKLARCTLTSTRFGDVFDHGLDLVHPPFWWAAWAAGLTGGLSENALALWVILGGYLVGRLLEGTFMLAFKIGFFEWRPFDALFRQVVARRNPNMILLSLGVLVGSPSGGFAAVAIWTVACVVVAAARNVQGHIATRRGHSVRSWLDDASQA